MTNCVCGGGGGVFYFYIFHISVILNIKGNIMCKALLRKTTKFKTRLKT